MRWLKSLVGLRKAERQQRRKEDGDAGRIVGASTFIYLPTNSRLFFVFFIPGFLSVFKFVGYTTSDLALVVELMWKDHIRVKIRVQYCTSAFL
jgi:hypothetical protein